jgi:ubiquinone/menaquinone biosynthesis C-methylase UbiE
MTRVAEESVVYTLGSSPAERERLRRQADELRAHAVALLDRVGLRPGHQAFDLGCGPSGVIDLLAERVGPAGHVTGLDASPQHVALARDFADERGLTNVTVVGGDARHTGLPSSAFNLVHARLVLVNIPDPDEVVAEMVRLTSPGGWVASQEADLSSLCYPPHPAVDRLGELLQTIYRQDGADPNVGRRLPEMFRDAGLVDVGAEVRADLFPVGSLRRSIVPDLVRSVRPKLLDRGILDEHELDELDRAARAHLDDPRTVTMPYMLFQAWGRKP